jgi:C-terminal processing protease CtpA/Prc
MHAALGIGMAAYLLVWPLGGTADQGLKNPDFEEGAVGAAPAGWTLTSHAGMATVSDDNPRHGNHCVRVGFSGHPLDAAPRFFVLLQQIDATPYRGKLIRLKAAVRIDASGPSDRAHLWLRVDRAGRRAGFFDNMADRPIRGKSWSEYEIEGDVAKDAERLVLGIMVFGDAPAWLDDVSLQVEGEAPAADLEPPRPLEGRGLENLVAFARLLGYVRHFHPSDQSARADWDRLAVDGVRAIEPAGGADELARRLQELIRPVAPTVCVFPSGAVPPLPKELGEPPVGKAIEVVSWEHVGYGGTGRVAGMLSVYQSQRARATLEDGKRPAGRPDPARPYFAVLGGGVSCLVPVALYASEDGTLPKVAAPEQPGRHARLTAEDRATRLAAVALGWNVLQHFYPYFDVVQADWPVALRDALAAAATDTDERGFLRTLRLMVAALHDGHGNVTAPNGLGSQGATLPLLWDWVQGRLVISHVADDAPGEAASLKPGTIVLAIDGRPTALALADAERTVSGATEQWRRYRALGNLAGGEEARAVSLEVEDALGVVRTVKVQRAPRGQQVAEPRPPKIQEVEPGILYVDIARVDDRDFRESLPRLEKAEGIIFDFRGYPGRINFDTFFPHLIDHPVSSPQWHIPFFTRPDQTDLSFRRQGEWQISPRAPYLKAKRAFVIDGRAISYAESCLGIVEHEKLGALVGAPTAGTNGNVNPVALPGGYSVIWTGMKVLKHDGSRHHGIGIQPTVPVSRTVVGVALGRDELLDKAVEVVRPTRHAGRDAGP